MTEDLKLLEWTRMVKILNDLEYENSGNLEIRELSIMGNSKIILCESNGMVHNVKNRESQICGTKFIYNYANNIEPIRGEKSLCVYKTTF